MYDIMYLWFHSSGSYASVVKDIIDINMYFREYLMIYYLFFIYIPINCYVIIILKLS